MTGFGTRDSRLILIRGNSASGKSTLARAVREALAPAPTAVVGQDETLRRHTHKRVTSCGEDDLARWWNGRQLIPGLAERLIPAEWELDRTVAAVVADRGPGSVDEERGR